VAFAEHRAWPENEQIKTKSCVYAGILSHYAADLCQPLHVTVHYDGRARPDGSSHRTGIHQKVDALIGKLAVHPPELSAETKAHPFPVLIDSVMAELGRSHALVDRVYELEKRLPGVDEALPDDVELRAFVLDRLEASALFIANLCLTAWELSATIELPQEHTRPEREE
jgi:hypothetical protein